MAHVYELNRLSPDTARERAGNGVGAANGGRALGRSGTLELECSRIALTHLLHVLSLHQSRGVGRDGFLEASSTVNEVQKLKLCDKHSTEAQGLERCAWELFTIASRARRQDDRLRKPRFASTNRAQKMTSCTGKPVIECVHPDHFSFPFAWHIA